MNQNYETIRAACQKVNPDLKGLWLGCEVSKDVAMSGGWHTVLGTVVKNSTYANESSVVDVYWQNGAFERQPISNLKILGHEPSLADVLMAIQATCDYQNITTSLDGGLWNEGEVKFDRIALGLIRKWDLSKPLKDQSPEVLSFIASLL